MFGFLFVLTIIACTALLILVARMHYKLEDVCPSFKTFHRWVVTCLIVISSSCLVIGHMTRRSETDVIKYYNQGKYQEKITYISIDGNIIPQDTVYIFKNK